MRVIDPAWIGKKLRGLKDLPEAKGDFFARAPGTEKQAVQPSTLAYVARLLIHRYGMLGVLDAEGYPLAGGADAVDRRAGARGDAAARRAGLPGVRAPGGDQARRLRFLHGLRVHRRLRLNGVGQRRFSGQQIAAGKAGSARSVSRKMRPQSGDGVEHASRPQFFLLAGRRSG